MPHALYARHAVFDGLGDLRFELSRRRAELRYRHRDDRDVGAGKPRHRELGEADPAEHQQDDRKDDGRQRIPNRPCRDIESHQRTRVRSSSSANMVLIWSPSCSEEPASATTISPTSSPSRISVWLSDVSPTRTLRVSMVLPLTTWTVRWSIAVLGTATPQLRLASMDARANTPIFSEGLLVTLMRTRPSCVARSISGETSRTRPIRSGASSRLILTVAPALSLGMCTAGTWASSSISLLTAMRNIGPACGEAGAPTMVRTSVTRPGAGALSETGPCGPGRCGWPGICGGAVRRASSWLSVTMVPSVTKRSVTLDPSWSATTTASRRGTKKPVTRTRSEKQALVDFVTMTSASLGVSLGSARCRCSNR